MDDLGNLFTGIMGGLAGSPKIGRDDVNGITVSTVESADMGPETALLDGNGAHPVERYSSLEDAKVGHKKWVKFAKSYKGQKVTELGYGDLVEPTKITLDTN